MRSQILLKMIVFPIEMIGNKNILAILCATFFSLKLATYLIDRHCIAQTNLHDLEIKKQWAKGSFVSKNEFDLISEDNELFVVFYEGNSIEIQNKKNKTIVYSLTVPDDSPKFDIPMSIEKILLTENNWLFIRTRLNNYFAKVKINNESIWIDKLVKIPELRSRQCDDFEDWFGGCKVSSFLYDSFSDKVLITGYEKRTLGYKLKQIEIYEGEISTINLKKYYICSQKSSF